MTISLSCVDLSSPINDDNSTEVIKTQFSANVIASSLLEVIVKKKYENNIIISEIHGVYREQFLNWNI